MIKNKEFRFITVAFLIWRISLYIFLYLGRLFLPLQKNFLGGGLSNYLINPSFWAWANFDGEHYLSIVQHGYGLGEHAFFPFYPALIGLFGNFFGNSLEMLTVLGLLISNIAILLSLFGLFKLVKIDFSEKIAKMTVILLLLFPTSFYFGSVYTESLFLCLLVWSFYFFRKEKYLLAGLLGMFASATRVIGILLLLVYSIELVFKKRKLVIRYLLLIIIPTGLLAYMFYLWKIKGDPLVFIHSLPSFGEQRSSTPILLPQVFYRYIFKILPNLNYQYFPIVFTTIMEFLIGTAFLFFSIISFFKIRLSYAFYLFLGYLVPTLSGSFSSLPRYVLVLFPAFLLFSIWILNLNKSIRIIIFVLLWLLLSVSTALFTRGYWLS